jgi:RimJ/RimL family protein N-acetyltransferase
MFEAEDRARLAARGADCMADDSWLGFRAPQEGEDLLAWASETLAEFERPWAESTGRYGAGLAVDDGEDSLVGMLSLAPRDGGGLRLSGGIAPSHRGRGIASRALSAASSWAVGEAGFLRVELWIAEWHVGSRRVAEKAGFSLAGVVVVESTDVLYVLNRR